MNRKHVTTFFFAIVGMASLGCGSKEVSTVTPATAPEATPKLEDVAQNAPAVLYFVKTDCGSNPEAIPLVQSIYAANQSAAKFYVVLNADADAAAKWASRNDATFPIIPDPDELPIGKYGIQSSQTGIVVDKDLKETKRFPGYGRKVLEDMNRSLAGDAKPAAVDLSAAPRWGIG